MIQASFFDTSEREGNNNLNNLGSSIPVKQKTKNFEDTINEPNKKDSAFQAFIDFQKSFYSDFNKFSKYTKFEISKYGFMLLMNISKGLPGLINIILNLKGFNFSGYTSYEILRALQHNLYNPYNYRLPQYLFYKTNKVDKKVQKKIKDKNGKEYYDFSVDIKREICSRLVIDAKTYEYLKYTDTIQKSGKNILGDIINKNNK